MKLSASQVLVQYAGAKQSKAQRSKKAAQALARKILLRAQGGEPLQKLAAEASDCPSKNSGGFLGAFAAKSMDPAFSAAVTSVEVGELVPQAVETEFGFHVIRREKVMHLGHVLIMHKESIRAHEGIERSQEEARAEAERLRELMSKEDASWDQIARDHSDCPTKGIGGDLGYFGRGARLLPAMAKASVRLQPGELSRVAQSEFGFHVIWRYADPGGSGSHPGQGEESTTDDSASGPAQTTGVTQ